MNLAHLRAILWMRWRMLVNLVKRRGKVGNGLFTVLIVLIVVIALGGLGGSFALGMELLPEAEPVGIMIAWSALVAALLFFWSIGVVTELQRSDAISIHSLLHLPASMLGAHLYNYLSSFVSVSLLVMLPPMIGLACASVLVLGPQMLLLFPLIAGLVGLLAALTYQLRGWLGTMIHDKRKQKNIIVALTVSFALLAQLPNLLNIAFKGDKVEFAQAELIEESQAGDEVPHADDLAPDPAPNEQPGDDVELAARAAAVDGDATSAEQSDSASALPTAEEKRKAARKARKKAELLEFDRWLTRAAIFVPFGWLPLGAKLMFEGQVLLSLLCLVGLLGLAALSLRRSYRTTLRFVTGIDGGKPVAAGALPVKARGTSKPKGELFVGRDLPFVSEATAGIAVASARGLLRSPEFKMVMLTPLLLLMFGAIGIFKADSSHFSGALRPYISLGAICMGLFTIMQLMQNQFGIDRHGFRAFVLSPTPRHYLLRGKNLACAPFAVTLSAIGVIAVQILYPESLTHFLSIWLLLISGFLITCLYSNQVSILAPMKLKEGVMKADGSQGKTVFVQVITLLLLPVLLSPIALPATLENLAQFLRVGRSLPIYLFASLAVFGASVWAYRFFIQKQGALLQDREQRILDALTRAVV